MWPTLKVRGKYSLNPCLPPYPLIILLWDPKVGNFCLCRLQPLELGIKFSPKEFAFFTFLVRPAPKNTSLKLLKLSASLSVLIDHLYTGKYSLFFFITKHQKIWDMERQRKILTRWFWNILQRNKATWRHWRLFLIFHFLWNFIATWKLITEVVLASWKRTMGIFIPNWHNKLLNIAYYWWQFFTLHLLFIEI